LEKIVECNGIGDYIDVKVNLAGTAAKTITGDVTRTFLEICAI